MNKKSPTAISLLSELESLCKRCNLNKKQLAKFLYDHGEEYYNETKDFDKFYALIRKQLNTPPKNPFILKKYIEILRENHRSLKKDIIFPEFIPEFDNEIDKLRFNKMMDKINNS